MGNKPIDKLDTAFSLYIRARDNYICISCGCKMTATTSQAGHYITRGNMATRFNERNVNAQCKSCNEFKSGNIPKYEDGLIAKYGEGILDELNLAKNQYFKLSDREMLELTKEYKIKYKMILSSRD